MTLEILEEMKKVCKAYDPSFPSPHHEHAMIADMPRLIKAVEYLLDDNDYPQYVLERIRQILEGENDEVPTM